MTLLQSFLTEVKRLLNLSSQELPTESLGPVGWGVTIIFSHTITNTCLQDWVPKTYNQLPSWSSLVLILIIIIIIIIIFFFFFFIIIIIIIMAKIKIGKEITPSYAFVSTPLWVPTSSADGFTAPQKIKLKICDAKSLSLEFLVCDLGKQPTLCHMQMRAQSILIMPQSKSTHYSICFQV